MPTHSRDQRSIDIKPGCHFWQQDPPLINAKYSQTLNILTPNL
jgi:hypothetical protein